MPARTVIKFPDKRLKEKSSLVEDFNSEETTNIISADNNSVPDGTRSNQ